MSEPSKSFDVEYEIKRRRKGLFVIAIVFTSMLGGVIAATDDIASHGVRAIDVFRIGAFIIIALGVLIFVLTGGPRAFRHPAMNDELVRANRAKALRLGYVVFVLSTMAIYVSSLFVAVDFSEVLPVLITVGIAVPTLSFAILEQNGEK